MKTRCTFVGLFCLVSCSAAFSQGYYEPGIAQTYRSLKASASNRASVLTVVFDAGGNATVSRSESDSHAGDKQRFQVLAPVTEVSLRSNSSDGNGEVDINGDRSKYWAVAFDGPSAERTGNSVLVECLCKVGSDGATCSVSFVKQGNSLNANCVQEAGCQTCEMKTTVVKDKSEKITGGVLLLKANSVTIQ
jgi:hypothetical protein